MRKCYCAFLSMLLFFALSPHLLPRAPQAPLVNGHKFSVLSLSFSSNGKTILSTGWDSMKLWDVHTGMLKQTFQTFADGPFPNRSAGFLSDNKLMSVSTNGLLRIWDALTGSSEQTISTDILSVRSVAFSADEKMVAIGSEGPNGQVILLQPQTGEIKQRLMGHQDGVTSLAFSADGKMLLSGSGGVWWNESAFGVERIEVKLWELKSEKVIWKTKGGGEWPVNSLEPVGRAYSVKVPISFSSDGSVFAITGHFDHFDEISVWQTDTLKLKRTWKSPFYGLNCVLLSPEGRVLAGGAAHDVKLWDVNTGQLKQTLKGHRAYVVALAFSPDGKTLASGDVEGNVMLWDLTQNSIADHCLGEMGQGEP